jgi:pilus assembly protein FimV
MQISRLPQQGIFKKTIRSLLFIAALSCVLSLPSIADTQYGPIKSNDALSRIVEKQYPGASLSKEQIMIGILRSNPDAFSGGNINFLLQGKMLTLPNEEAFSSISKKEAEETIKLHMSLFKKGQTGRLPVIPLPSTTPAQPSDDNLKKIENEKNHLKQELDNEKEKATKHLKEVERLENENKSKNRELNNLEQKIRELESTLSAQQKDIKENSDASESDTDKLDSEKKEIIKKNEEQISKLKGRNSQLVRQLEDTKDKLKTTQQQVAELETQLASEKKKNSELEASLKQKQLPVVETKKQDKDNNEDNKASTSPASQGFNLPSWLMWLLPLLVALTAVSFLINRLLKKRSRKIASQALQPAKHDHIPTTSHQGTHGEETFAESIDPESESLEADIKIDMAKAYIELNRPNEARELLNEVMQEGNNPQQTVARKLLETV